jgi:hypothetical protein
LAKEKKIRRRTDKIYEKMKAMKTMTVMITAYLTLLQEPLQEYEEYEGIDSILKQKTVFRIRTY